MSEVNGAMRSYQVAIVGLGLQGRGIAILLAQLGHHVVGAVDVGALMGQRLATVVGADVSDAVVSGSIEGMLDRADTQIDVAVIAASVDLATTLDMAGRFLDRGINVITLNPEGFAYDPSWVTPLQMRAVAGNVTLLNTGVQDLWWVQLITLVAASAVNIKKLALIEAISLEVLSAAIGEKTGIGFSAEAFAAHIEKTAARPSVIGAPLAEVARRMGAKAGPIQKTVRPIFKPLPYEWISGGCTIPADRVQGFEEHVKFETDRGFRVEGTIAVVPGEAQSPANEIRIEGLPDLSVQFGSLSNDVTNIALIARIPDVVNAVPGILFAADMPPPRHHFPITSL